MKSNLPKAILVVAVLFSSFIESNAQVTGFDTTAYGFENGAAENWTQNAGFTTSTEQAVSGTNSMKAAIDGNTNVPKLQTWRNSGLSDGLFDVLAGDYELSIKVYITGNVPTTLNFAYNGTASAFKNIPFTINELAPNTWHTLTESFNVTADDTGRWFAIQFFSFPESGLTGNVYVDDVTLTSAAVAGNESLSLDAYKIYPNPSNDYVNIAAPKNSLVRLFNSLGVQVMSLQYANDKQTISTKSLPKGLYFVKIESNGKIATEKLIVN
ncbi:T9SS type A sorting domain-containing protein [Flavicella sediminum]|uniref:T9SS type A sorting domain-containing protein n=1 Tax=Flavicella sediminum TaxID=2585141 RepID=UPI0011244E9D|nr:T9SS type A sorting domain-containing protein [Flavicella sediminum]